LGISIPTKAIQDKSNSWFTPAKKARSLRLYLFTNTLPMQPIHEEKIEMRVISWLTDKGYDLIKRNWQYCHGQVDIIASRFNQLHFIGIATKKYPENGLPDQGITRRKMLSFLQASQQYIKLNPQWNNAVIDVLTVTMVQDEPKDCVMIKDIWRSIEQMNKEQGILNR
jgi:putative endonuclease